MDGKLRVAIEEWPHPTNEDGAESPYVTYALIGRYCLPRSQPPNESSYQIVLPEHWDVGGAISDLGIVRVYKRDDS